MQANIPCLLQSASIKHPNEMAVISESERITFLELEHKVESLALYFKERGIKTGDRVIIAQPNNLTLLISILTLFRIGAWCCPVNPKFPDNTFKKISSTLEPHWSITVNSNDMGPAQNINSHAIERYLIHTANTREATSTNNSFKNNTPITYPANTPCSVILTSGTSGTPKAAVFAYQQHVYSAKAANALIPLAVSDRSLLSLPLFHIGGLAILFRCLLAGATVVLGSNKNLVENLKRFKVTHASMVSTQLYRLLKQDINHLSLKYALVGGGPVEDHLLNEARDAGIHCWKTYGLTEMSSQVYTHAPSGRGKRLEHSEIMINNQQEICVKGKTLFLGYYDANLKNANKLSLPLDKNGWFKTKDLARFMGDKLEIVGRKDNQFISGGENIQPEEIEYFVKKIHGVIQCVVVPQKDTEYGFRPVIYIESETPIPLTTLHYQLKPYLPSFKHPIAIHSWQESHELKASRKHFTNQLVCAKQ